MKERRTPPDAIAPACGWRRAALASAVAMAAWLGAPSPAAAATQAQIDQARDRAAAWLIQNQKGDGQWSNGGGTDISVSAQALVALVAARVKGFPVLNANTWLLNSKPESVDALSRILIAGALPAVTETGGFQLLLSWKNTDVVSPAVNLWGAYPQYTTSIPDTALAWRAILATGYNLAAQTPLLAGTLCNTLNAQRADGGFGINRLPSGAGGVTAPATMSAGSVLATTQMVAMLQLAKVKVPLGSYSCGTNLGTQVDASIGNAVTWLATTARNADGGVGEDGVSTRLATALAYLALETAAPAHPVKAALLDYMIPSQNADGSWNGDPLITAVMLEGLSKVATPAIQDTDGDGVPDSIEVAMGTNPNAADTRFLAAKPTGAGRPGVTLPLMIANQVVVGQPYAGGVSVTGGTGPYRWSITGGALPPGLALAPTSTGPSSTISGTPTALGIYTFEYTVQDATNASASTIGQLTVVRAAPGNGDVNGDGKVDLADVILAQRIALGIAVPTAAQRAAADVAPPDEPDGIIDAADVARILRKALEIDSF